MKQLYCRIFVSVSLLLITEILSAQEKVITLSQPVTGTKEYVARDEVRLLPGFTYTAISGHSFLARTDKSLLCDVDYIPLEELPDPDTRQM